MDRRSFLKTFIIGLTATALPIPEFFVPKTSLLAGKAIALDPNDHIHPIPFSFGDGSDGNLFMGKGSVVTLQRDMYFNNLDMNNGGIIETNGYRVHVMGTLSLGVDARFQHGS